ncbi:cell volume regulation protein A [Catalinimonas alkaloidigena]|uniref:Cell volume regulation protein A n=1 Tax=Catalinimonas alkaloidigena TaxID=1075417 RepID=A0A1G9IIQ8_9BACT|nr:potassium/proton antiporter [Catalinimonas alkaloidigena]SDL25169.1 cell volume regulation protein A [Catalinimonas alkaloidigena]
MLTLPYAAFLVIAGVLVILSILGGRFLSRFGFSSLLVTLGIGMLVGNGGRYDFDFDYPLLTLRISEMALSVIIFAGGFTSEWKRFRPVLWQGISLATLGVLLTALCVALFVHFVLGWAFLPALLLGAIISSTDAAAVFSILENTGLRLKQGVSEVLELESGTNDPMAYFLTFSLTTLLLLPDQPVLSLLPGFVLTMLIGLGSGLLLGRVTWWIITKVTLKRGQNIVVLIGLILVLYGLNVLLGGSAFLAIYTAGLVLGNAPWQHRQLNIHFFEGLSWLMETGLFLLLGLQVYLQELTHMYRYGLYVALLLIVVARPVGTYLSLLFFRSPSRRGKVFFAWVGLRGATPIVFALIPVVQRVPQAELIFNISFIVVIVSILVQGTTVAPVARWLGLEEEASAHSGKGL